MKMDIIGIYDKKAEIFISLEPTSSIAVSLRQITEVCNKQTDNPIYKWPADYSLWHLGHFETTDGFVECLNAGKRGPGKKLLVEVESLKTPTN